MFPAICVLLFNYLLFQQTQGTQGTFENRLRSQARWLPASLVILSNIAGNCREHFSFAAGGRDIRHKPTSHREEQPQHNNSGRGRQSGSTEKGNETANLGGRAAAPNTSTHSLRRGHVISGLAGQHTFGLSSQQAEPANSNPHVSGRTSKSLVASS